MDTVFDYLSYGNYYSDYITKNPNATETSGIYDTPYVIYGNISDKYPLVDPYIATNNVPLPTPRFPQPTPTATPTHQPTIRPVTNNSNNQSPTSTPAVPELSWLVILPMILSMFSVALLYIGIEKPTYLKRSLPITLGFSISQHGQCCS